MDPKEKEAVDTGVIDAAPVAQPEDNGLPPDPVTETPVKLIAGKYKTLEDAEKGIHESEARMHAAIEAQKRAETERQATMEAFARLSTNSAPQEGKKGPTLDELKEQLREDPSKVLDIMFERDEYWKGVVLQQREEMRALATEYDPAYVQVKEDVTELQKEFPNAPREMLVKLVTKARSRVAVPLEPEQRIESQRTPVSMGMNGRRSAPATTGTPFRFGRDEVVAMKNLGLTDAEIMEAQKARAAR